MRILNFQSSSGKLKTTIFPFIILILMWGIFILPSSFYPNWSYLDDPTTLLMGKSIAEKLDIPKPDGVSGRYFPFYNIYYGLLFSLFGFKLYGYYIVQSLLFLLTLILIYLIVNKITESITSGIFAAFLALTASPVAENLYTFGKPEPKIIFYLVLALYLFITLNDKNKYRKKLFNIISWLSITLLIFISVLTKETALVFIIFAFVGAAIAFAFLKRNSGIDKDSAKSYFLLLICSFCSIILARGLYFILKPSNVLGTYTTYNITLEMIINNLKFYVSQQPDIFFLILICIFLLILLYKNTGEIYSNSFLFASALFFTGLAYILGQLIWRWALGYYLLVPSTFFCIVIGLTLGSLIHFHKFKKVIYISVTLILLTRFYTIPYFHYIANSQKLQDKIYTKAIENYIQRANPGERLLVEQWLFYEEPVTQSNLLIEKILGKEQLYVVGTQDIISNVAISSDILKLYNVNTIPDKANRSPRENDFILNLTGNRQSYWILRGYCPFFNKKESVYIAQGLQLNEVASNEVSWRGFEMKHFFDMPKFRGYSAGYKLYKVKSALPIVLWEGRWADNWIGNKAKCSLRIPKQKKEFYFTGNATNYTVPTFLIIKQNNKIIKRVTIDKAGPFFFALTLFSSKNNDLIDIEFHTEKTFNPKKSGFSNDDRNLSVQLDIQKSKSLEL